MENVYLRHARMRDLQDVYRLYRSSVGSEGCAWDEEYPGRFELERDFTGKNLYVLTDGHSVLGAVSVVNPSELAGEDVWTPTMCAEIARVVVEESVSGQGYASFMLREVFRVLKEQGIEGIRLSVSIGNEAALRLYHKLGFRFLKHKELYGGEYFLCEKLLRT